MKALLKCKMCDEDVVMEWEDWPLSKGKSPLDVVEEDYGEVPDDWKEMNRELWSWAMRINSKWHDCKVGQLGKCEYIGIVR